MAPRNVHDTIEAAIHQGIYGPAYPLGRCLQAVRTAYWVEAKYPTATDAWQHTRQRLPDVLRSTAGAGLLAWWLGGSHGLGHVGISLGAGRLLSVDIGGAGLLRPCTYEQIAAWAPALVWAGFSRDVNDVSVVRAKPWKPWEGPEEPMRSLLQAEAGRWPATVTGDTQDGAIPITRLFER